MTAIQDRYTVDALLRLRLGRGLADYALIELDDVMKGLQQASEMIAEANRPPKSPLEGPLDWFKQRAVTKHG